MKKMQDDEEGIADVYKALIDLVGMENTKQIYSAFRGQQVSFPKKFYRSDFILKEVLEKYDGSNLRELALKYDYTERHLRKIIKEHRKTDR